MNFLLSRWHSHTSWQYSEGMWGILIIDNPNEPYKDYYPKENDVTITLNDWYHQSGRTNTDWYMSSVSGGRSPIPDSAMMNGRGFYPCNTAAKKGLSCTPQNPETIEVRRLEKYRIRIINTSVLLTFQFTIDEHYLHVIEVDGVDTTAVCCQTLTIAPAQRYSVIVHMNARKDSFKEQTFLIQAKMVNSFGEGSNITPEPQTIVKYSGQPKAYLKYQSLFNNENRKAQQVALSVVDQKSTNTKASAANKPKPSWPLNATPQEELEFLLENPGTLRPGQQIAPAKPNRGSKRPTTNYNSSLADFTIEVETTASQVFGTSQTRGYNSGTRTGGLEPPLTMLDEKDLHPFDKIYAPGYYDQEIRLSIDFVTDPVTLINYATFNGIRFKATGKPIIFRMLQKKGIAKSCNPLRIKNANVVQVVITNPGALPHPFHLHGHTFWVAGRGPIDGPANWTLTGARRDTVVVEGRENLYIRFVADNPGAWLFHCHINWHHQAGLAAVFVESPAEAIKLYETLGVPKAAVDLCRDSGVKM